MSRSQINGGSGECFHEKFGTLWQCQHGDMFTIRLLTGPASVLSRDPSVYSAFSVSLAFRAALGARGISGTPPTAQPHKVPGPTLRACYTQDLKHLTNAGLLWLFHVAIDIQILCSGAWRPDRGGPSNPFMSV